MLTIPHGKLTDAMSCDWAAGMDLIVPIEGLKIAA
jgi:hypothetical protein